jgi:hypothetical protein
MPDDGVLAKNIDSRGVFSMIVAVQSSGVESREFFTEIGAKRKTPTDL